MQHLNYLISYVLFICYLFTYLCIYLFTYIFILNCMDILVSNHLVPINSILILSYLPNRPQGHHLYTILQCLYGIYMHHKILHINCSNHITLLSNARKTNKV